jgi:hypothetical protein
MSTEMGIIFFPGGK